QSPLRPAPSVAEQYAATAPAQRGRRPGNLGLERTSAPCSGNFERAEGMEKIREREAQHSVHRSHDRRTVASASSPRVGEAHLVPNLGRLVPEPLRIRPPCAVQTEARTL